METTSCLNTLWDYLAWAYIGICALNLSKQKPINKVFCIWVYIGNLTFKYKIKWEDGAHFRLQCPLS